MNRFKEFEEKLKKVTGESNIYINEAMSKHTNFKLGGPADLLVIPDTKEELINILNLSREMEIPTFVIGNGSNLIVKDGGIRGLVVKLEKLKSMKVEEDSIIADCGAELKDLSTLALENNLTGMEFACGIPGSLGGAVFMNAGAYLGEMKQVLDSVTALDNKGNIINLKRDELDLSYRSSVIKKKGYIVLDAIMKLEKGEHETIKERIDLLTFKREDKQPLEMPSAGSTFKRPDGYYAGKLIEDAGLKGYCYKGAAVSDKHSGFIINKNNATALEVLELIAYVQKVVKEKFGVDLETEVLIVGEDK